MNNNFLAEIDQLVAKFNEARSRVPTEYRLYYNPDGTIIGIWNEEYPNSGTYIILDELSTFNNSNTHLLRVQNKKLIVLDPCAPEKARLQKATSGFRVVKGNAALILEHNETYSNIEYYDRKYN